MRVLIVENVGIIAFGHAAMLTEWGHQVIGTLSAGHEVNDFVKTHSPDLILMNVGLKDDISGLEVAKNIRFTSSSPIIFITGYAQINEDKIKSIPNSTVLHKPLKPKLLKEAIEKYSGFINGNLCQLIYSSSRTCSLEEIDAIYKTSLTNNEQENITGVLLFSDSNFLQYLEGSKESLHHLYFDKIIKDPRHHNIRLLSFEECEKRNFPNWSLAKFEFTEGELHIEKIGDRPSVNNLKDLIFSKM